MLCSKVVRTAFLCFNSANGAILLPAGMSCRVNHSGANQATRNTTARPNSNNPMNNAQDARGWSAPNRLRTDCNQLVLRSLSVPVRAIAFPNLLTTMLARRLP